MSSMRSSDKLTVRSLTTYNPCVVTMEIMLPIATDNGARLAAILPTGLAALARGQGSDPVSILHAATGLDSPELTQAFASDYSAIPALRSFVLIVVDGLGYSNLQARAGHARALAGLRPRRIDTVIPSTTGAALTTLMTGRLPGVHGLIGYRIRHPRLGLLSTLKDWSAIADPSNWQRSQSLLELAERLSVRAVAIGRPAHASSGLTQAILRGAEFHGAVTIAERFGLASRTLRDREPTLAYVYVDELDKAGHAEGWGSALWLRRLEQFDAALSDFLRTLPGDVGVVVTADHGIIDVPADRRVMLDHAGDLLAGVEMIGGEPRMRSLYLDPQADPVAVQQKFTTALGKRAWVGSREEAIAGNWFGVTSPEVAHRLGDILLAARGSYAFMLQTDTQTAREMIGQHGGISDDERGVPLALAGALSGSGFASAISRLSSVMLTGD